MPDDVLKPRPPLDKPEVDRIPVNPETEKPFQKPKRGWGGFSGFSQKRQEKEEGMNDGTS